jgi:bleomycin hydrolase
MSAQAITLEQIESYQEALDRDPRTRLALNAVTKNAVQSVALDRIVATRTNHTFSHALKTNAATQQSQSGRCWLFAGLNLFRVEAMKRLNLEQFELSQTYLMFWDKLEKANYFLETILDTTDEPTDGRLIMFLLQQPLQDGGQWDMFVNLVNKYGVVPKALMPESVSSSNSRMMNGHLTGLLREDAAELRRMSAGGADATTLRERKEAMLGDLYRMLCVHLGELAR